MPECVMENSGDVGSRARRQEEVSAFDTCPSDREQQRRYLVKQTLCDRTKYYLILVI